MRFLNPELDRELRAALALLAQSHSQDRKRVVLGFTGKGKRRVQVGYLLETPVWKTSYRLVLGGEQSHFLQGWAIVENTTDQDWRGVKLALVSGRPGLLRHGPVPAAVPQPPGGGAGAVRGAAPPALRRGPGRRGRSARRACESRRPGLRPAGARGGRGPGGPHGGGGLRGDGGGACPRTHGPAPGRDRGRAGRGGGLLLPVLAVPAGEPGAPGVGHAADRRARTSRGGGCPSTTRRASPSTPCTA